MAEKMGRKRVYVGDDRERHKQAVAKYVERMKSEAAEIGVPLRRHLQKNRKQLSVYIETELHDSLKAEAKRRNMTMRELVTEKLKK